MSQLRIVGITKSFGTRAVLANLSFTADSGSMLAVAGPSGSGKSTLLNIIGLLEEPTAGSAMFGDVELTRLRGRAATRFRRRELGYLFQNYALIESATVRSNLEVVRSGRGRGRQARTRMDELLDQVGLPGQLDSPVAQLSGGEQQRVALVRLLLKEPRLILADEPTGALDQDNGRIVVSALRGLAARGATVLIATHSPEVIAACDDVLDLGLHPVEPAQRPLATLA